MMVSKYRWHINIVYFLSNLTATTTSQYILELGPSFPVKMKLQVAREKFGLETRISCRINVDYIYYSGPNVNVKI